MITSVEIQRWNSATLGWDPLRSHTVSLDDAADPPTAYTTASLTHTDTDVDDGTTYIYRVRAVNEAGGGGWTTSTSTTANAAPDKPVLSATVERPGHRPLLDGARQQRRFDHALRDPALPVD